MNRALKIGTLGIMFGYLVACSPVQFNKAADPVVEAPTCGGNGVSCVQTCQGDACTQNYEIKKIVGKSMVDILIVNDNSGSMSTEQRKMGDAFGAFVQSLNKLDFRIGMITTDVSSAHSSTPANKQNWPSSINGNGALQDGKLIDFGGGTMFLTDVAQESMFKSTVSRPETARCENSGYQECPADDERGIFAASLALDRNEFLREKAHLAVIVLSDEDERGVTHEGTESGNDRQLANLYPLEDRDLPSNFVSKFKTMYPSKTLSVHSMIIKPGDSACRTMQSSQGSFVSGRYGYQYAKLSGLTNGIVGSICDGYFDQQLADIGTRIQQRTLTLPFSCRPVGDAYTLKASNNQSVASTVDWTTMELTITTQLPALTEVTLSYKCPK